MHTVSEEIKKSLRPVFERYADEVVFAYLFGSAAKEEGSPLSDVDIAVFLSAGSRNAYFDIKLSLYGDICRTLKTNDVDIVVLNTSRNLFLLGEIIRNGLIIYESDQDIRDKYEVNILHRSIDFKTQRIAVIGK